jgi:transposase
VAFEPGWNSWKVASTIGARNKPRIRHIPARDTDAMMAEIRNAKRRFRLPETTPVTSSSEAGRDGFWPHRFLASTKVGNLVVDASSTEVNRRGRRPRSDTRPGSDTH